MRGERSNRWRDVALRVSAGMLGENRVPPLTRRATRTCRTPPVARAAVLAVGLLLTCCGNAATSAALRVVSQTVGGDEFLLALAEPAQVVALSHLSRDPAYSAVAAQAQAYPQLVRGDAETILKFAPTLVLFADYSRGELVEQVRRAGVRVLVFEHYKTLDDAYASLRELAVELGAEAKAERLIAECRARVAALRQRLRDVRPVRVIAPSTYGVIPGYDSTFQDLCDHAGAENLAATLGGLHGHAAPPAEKMLTWPIDKVVLAGTERDRTLAVFQSLAPYQFMPAVREGRVAMIAPHQISCISHHRIDGYEQLARALHPEVFR